MRMRTFSAASLPQAMSLVRKHMGDDAIILDTQELDADEVRVTAAVEDGKSREQDELLQRGLEASSAVGEILTFHRVPIALSDRIVAEASHSDANSQEMILAEALDSLFRFSRSKLSEAGERRTVAVLGTAGSAKSATAAKICMMAKLEGDAPILVSLEAGSAKSSGQIETYAKAMGIPHAVIDHPSMLSEVMATYDKGCIVLDCFSISPLDREECERLVPFLELSQAECIGTIAANSDAIEAAETAEVLAELGARRLIATRLDASRRVGCVLAAATGGCQALGGATTAPELSSGVSPLTAVGLARLMISKHDDWQSRLQES